MCIIAFPLGDNISNGILYKVHYKSLKILAFTEINDTRKGEKGRKKHVACAHFALMLLQ